MRIPEELLEHMGYAVIRELVHSKLISAESVENAEKRVSAVIKRDLARELEIEAEAKRLLDANRALLTASGGDYFIALQKFKQQVAKQKKFVL